MKFKFLSQIKTKGQSPGAKNKNISDIEAGLKKSSSQQDWSRFEWEVNETFQTSVENCKVDRSEQFNRTSRTHKGGRVGRASKNKELSRIAKSGKIDRASLVGRAKGKRNRSVTINRTRAKKAGRAETD